jgi:hypothetical protein
MTFAIPIACRGARSIARAFAISACFAAGALQAQVPKPAPLATPDLDVWTSGVINAVERDASGALIVAGIFQQINGVPRTNLARLLADGTLDPNFTPNPNFGVQDIAIAADGSIYVAGSFDVIGGQSHAKLARLSSTGVVDAAWNPSVDSAPQSIALGDDELYLGGFFSTVNGQPRPRLARVLASGSGQLDFNWVPTANSTVSEMVYDPADDSLFIGGDFTAINNTTRARLAKLDGGGTGTLRAWDAPASSGIYALELDGTGSLYVAGGFTSIGANGASRQSVARLSTVTGDADAFSLTFPAGTNGAVLDMALDGTSLYLGGAFTHVNGTARAFAAKVSTIDASLDTTFTPSPDQLVFLVFAPGNGAVYLSGSATRYVNGDTRVGAAVVDAGTGATLAPLDVVIPGVVYAMVALPGGGQIIGGDFYRIEGSARENLAKLRADGSVDPDWVPTVDDRVRTLAIDDGGTVVYAAGVFDAANDTPRNALAKFSTAGTGALQAWDAGIVERAALEPVRALAVDATGKVYVGGTFQQIAGQFRSYAAKLAGDTAMLDAAWDALANASVVSLAISPGGSVYASGFFTQINGQARARFAKLNPVDGAVDLAFSADLSPSGTVSSYGFASEGLYISGTFTSVGGTPRGYVARIDPASGAVDPAWAPAANREVYNVLPAGGSVFLAGFFSNIDGTLRIQLAKVSAATGSLDPEWDPQVYDGSLVTAVLDPAGNVLIGGSFGYIGTTKRQGLAAIPASTVVVVLPPHIFGNGFDD